ncbi:MAG TPA: hypothetical protein VMB22_07560 [Verrucomicrobiae bacterium]|nr:hypothetical protein [Verrucomicrobiae bacterium]
MKTLLPVLVLTLLAVCHAPAQVVSVEVILDKDQFLPNESVPVKVRITNLSGQTLHLGADPDWLTFDVEADNFLVVQNAQVPVTGAFDLPSTQMATKRVDLYPYFDMSKPGRYHIVATVHIKDWSAKVVSPSTGFDVITGAKLWSQDFGVPMPPDMSNQPPEVRKYTVEQANYMNAQPELYVMVSDASLSQVFKVTPIGPMISFSHPEMQLDRFSNLHVIWQDGAKSFDYTVVDPTGAVIEQSTYDYFNTRPRLGMDDRGNIVVVGGVLEPNAGVLPIVMTPDELSFTTATNAVTASNHGGN